MRPISRFALALLVSALIPLSSAVSAANQPAALLLAQQSDEATLQEATRLNDQAFKLYKQGNYAEAEPFYQRALQIREQSLGDTHPDVALRLNNLAMLYQVQGNFEKVLPLWRRGLSLEEINAAEVLSVGSDARKQAYAATLQASTVTT